MATNTEDYYTRYMEDKNNFIERCYHYNSCHLETKSILKDKKNKIFRYNNHNVSITIGERYFAIFIDQLVIWDGRAIIGADYSRPWKSVVRYILTNVFKANPPFVFCMIDSLIGHTDYYINQFFTWTLLEENENGFSFWHPKGVGNGWCTKNI